MEVWPTTDSVGSEIKGKKLISLLINGDLKNQCFNSKVYLENSSTFEIKESLYILKTTNFHTKTSWFLNEYPCLIQN